MSIKTRVGLALGTVLILHVFTAVMGHIGLEKAQRDLAAYERANGDTIKILAVDKMIAELQRNVSVYMLTGHTSAAQHVRDLQARAETEIRDAHLETDRIAAGATLKEMGDRIHSYGQNFEKVATDRATRIRLMQEEMIPARNRVLDRLERDRGRTPASLVASHAISSLMLRSESEALRYFDSPSRTNVERALGYLSDVRDAAGDLDRAETREEIIASVDEYERAFLDAVQATRGYLHLVNVVLAGEAAELHYLSREVRARSLEGRETFLSSTQAGSKRFQIISDIVSILTVLAGIVTASFMSRALIHPILRMTETLRRLARGESQAKIEGLDRTDEIGDMAGAAEVFRIKNIETETLLVESQRMSADLELRNKEMSQFVYTVSHDLSSPLVTIRGYAGALTDALETESPDEIREIAGRISRASGRMAQTVDDLLELSRQGAAVNEAREIDLDALCESVLADLSSQLSQAGAQVRIDHDMPIFVAEEVRIRQLLQNLVLNALTHGRPDTGTPIIEISARRDGGQIVLSVTDNGNGVDPKYNDKIFRIFQRLSHDRTGTGVGLAIVKAIAEAHGGRAWIDSEPGQGAAFHVSIRDIPLRSAVA